MNAPVPRRVPWLCAWVLLSACAPPASPSNSVLQRQCDLDAGAWFHGQHPDGVAHETVNVAIRTEQYSFSDHYNPRLKGCMVVTSTEKSVVYPDKPAEGVASKSLVDLNTHETLGWVIEPWPAADHPLRDCEVQSKRCTSTRQWEELAAPFMER